MYIHTYEFEVEDAQMHVRSCSFNTHAIEYIFLFSFSIKCHLAFFFAILQFLLCLFSDVINNFFFLYIFFVLF